MADVKNETEKVYSIVVLSDDVAFYNQVAAVIDPLIKDNKKFSLVRIPLQKKILVQEIIIQLVNQEIIGIFIDVATSYDVANRTLYLISQIPKFNEIVITAFIKDTRDEKVIYELIKYKINFFFRKSVIEYQHVFCTLVKSFMDGSLKGKEEAFFQTKASLEVDLCFPHLLSAMNDKEIIFESNFEITGQQKIQFDSNFFHRYPSLAFNVTKKSQEGIYYPYNFQYYLTYDYLDFVPEELKEEEEDPKKVKKAKKDDKKKENDAIKIEALRIKNEENQKKYLEDKKRCFEWIDEYFLVNKTKKSFPKMTKVLIIDRSMSVLSLSKKNLDEYLFNLRARPFITDGPDTIKRYSPAIIVFVFQEEEEIEEDKIQIEELLKSLSTFEAKKQPILIFFNSPFDSESLKTRLSYPKILADRGACDFDKIMKYSNSVNLHLEKTLKEISYIIFSKKSDEAQLSLKLKTKIIKISENYLLFQSAIDIPLLSVGYFFLEDKQKIFINVVEKKQDPDGGKGLVYRGMIHGLDEKELENMRRAVFSIEMENKGKKN